MGVLLAALVLVAAPPAYATEETPGPSDPPTDEEESSVVVLDDAQLAWGLNLEASNRAFAPGTVNMLGAGTINPGGGGRKVTPDLWRPRDGDVRIEKAGTDDVYRPATWAGLFTQSDGSDLGSPSAGTFSNHRVVLDGGSGEVDPGAGTAEIAWDGTFTVLFYSGMSTFTVSDPVLEVTPRRAVLRGTLGGWASSMDDASKWEPMRPAEVVLADLDRSALDLPATGGLTAAPAYAGVRYDAPADAAPQVRTGEAWGSWPRSFVDFQQRAGSASYWYSSGGATDAWKVATPLTVSWEASDPLDPPTPPPPVDAGDDPDQPDAPDAPSPPPDTGGVTPPGPTSSSTPTTSAGGATDRTPRGGSAATPAAPVAAPPPVSRALEPVASPVTTPDHRWHWWVGSLLLLGAAALLVPRVRPTTRNRSTPRGNP